MVYIADLNSRHPLLPAFSSQLVFSWLSVFVALRPPYVCVDIIILSNLGIVIPCLTVFISYIEGGGLHGFFLYFQHSARLIFTVREPELLKMTFTSRI